VLPAMCSIERADPIVARQFDLHIDGADDDVQSVDLEPYGPQTYP
jgi:hypothetical protein